MVYPQGVKPASRDEEGCDAASETERVKPLSRVLAKQVGKLKNVFKRQGTEVQSSSARLGQHHGKPLHETQHKENIPGHGQSSIESLQAGSDEQWDRIARLFPPNITSSLFTSTRPEEPTQPDGIDPSSVPPLSQTNNDLNRTFNPPSSTQQQYIKSTQPYTSQETKRRRRRESHNVVERQRRDKINELIQQLSHLVPLHRLTDYNAKLSSSEKTGQSLEHGPHKGDILNGTVNWTRDLMGALYGKIQQHSKAREYIDSLGGTWPFESNEDERRLQNEVIDAFDANGQIAVSSRPWDSEINSKRPERFGPGGSAISVKRPERSKPWENAIKVKGANHSEPALRTKASHGSLVSFSGSVHSFTSLTYRSASGEIKTEYSENVANFAISRENIDIVPGDKLREEKGDEGVPGRHSMLPFPQKTGNGPSHHPYLGRKDAGQGFVPSTQNFTTSPTYEELDNAPGLGQDKDGARKPDKQSSKPTPESPTSLYSLDGSRRDDVFPSNSQRLDEADALATNHLADVNDLSVQNQTQPPIAAKMDEEAGLRPFRLHEDSPLGPRSSIASFNSHLSIASFNSHQDMIESDPRVTYLENKFVRLRWKCSCNRPFQVDVFEHEKGAALAAIQELDQSDHARDESYGPLYRLFMFLIRIKFLLHIFSDKRERDDTLPITNPLPTKADDISQTRLDPADPDPERYVCVCFPGMTYKKYLHHVDVNKTIDDQQLFAAMQKKYYDWKPFWRRIFTLQTLARVEYFEFKIYYSNLVTIKDDWRDRFPQGHDPGEWSYNPPSRDMTPYLIDDVLTHYVHSPQCAKIGKYFWNRIPKKVFCKLECPNDKPFKVGWGLYFVEEFSQFYLMLILVPVLAAGVALATWYCIWFQKSFADGATVVSGFAAVVMYIFSVAQGWYKQKGAL